MPTYIVLGKFTQKGIENIKNSPKRRQGAIRKIKALGGEMKAFYYTMGQYDYVSVMEFPDNDEMMKSLFSISSEGNVRTETLVAISPEKAVELMKELP